MQNPSQGRFSVQDLPKNKKTRNTWKSFIVPSLLILVLILAAGLLVINSLSTFYYNERANEASLLSKSYTYVLSTVLDAKYELEQQMHSTLKVAGITVSKYHDAFSNELLAEMADNLDVDVLYLYDKTLVITHSSDDSYFGWEAPEAHPVRDFYESGELFQAEAIRADTVSGINYKYGYYRFDDGRMVQVGILASNIEALYAQFEPQYIVDRMSRDATQARFSLLDPNGVVIASTDPEVRGLVIDPERMGLPISESSFVRTEWGGINYLALHFPIMLKDTFAGSLALFYDLTQIEQLMFRLTLIISLTLLVFYLLFAYSLFTVYRKNRRILHLAYLDELTGLPNLRNFHAHLEELRCQHLALVVLNPLNFKLINLLYGYEHGNTVLIQIAKNLRTISRHKDNIRPFRLSDDRFLLIIKNEASLEELLLFCRDLLTINEEPGLVGSIGMSIGLVQSTGPTHDGTRLLKHALIALNSTSPVHQIQVYNTELEEMLIRADAIEQELKQALDGEEGILSLDFQPIYNSKISKITSYEALARMHSRKLGTISPIEFIAIAENRQLIIPLGQKILSLACDFIVQLRNRGIEDVTVAVNVSALQLMDETFISSVMLLANEKNIPFKQLEIELTESVFAQYVKTISAQLESVRHL